jgi:hydrogenase-4 component B
VLLPAVLAIALHHLLVKPMLFLGLGLWQRGVGGSWLLAGLVLLALSLAAAPLTGGGAAKAALDGALDGRLGGLLLFSGIGTVLLMVRFLWLLGRLRRRATGEVERGPAAGWLLLLPLAVWGPLTPDGIPLTLQGLGPLAAGLGLALAALAIHRRLPPPLRLALLRAFAFTGRPLRRIRLRHRGLALPAPAWSVHTWLRPTLSNASSLPAQAVNAAPALGWLLLMLALLAALALET